MELQGKLNDFARNLSQVRAKISAAEREKKRSELTLKEIETLPADTKTYKSVGNYTYCYFFLLLLKSLTINSSY